MKKRTRSDGRVRFLVILLWECLVVVLAGESPDVYV